MEHEYSAQQNQCMPTYEQLQQRIAELEAQVKQLQDANSSLWAVAMNAAAYLEEASYCIKGDEEAKQSALGAAQHVRTCCIKHGWAIEAAHNIK